MFALFAPSESSEVGSVDHAQHQELRTIVFGELHGGQSRPVPILRAIHGHHDLPYPHPQIPNISAY